MPNGVPPQQGPTIVVPGQGWIDVLSRVIVQVGFPVVVAGVLLWYLLGNFQNSMLSMMARMESNAEMAAKLIAVASTEYQEIQQQSIELRNQSGELTQQTKLMAEIAKDANELVRMRSEELEVFKQMKTILEKRQP